MKNTTGRILLTLCLVLYNKPALSILIQWDTKDTSFAGVRVGEGGIFEWESKKFGKLKLTGGKGGSSFIVSDDKTKKGKGKVSITDLTKLFDSLFGLLGEPPVAVSGQIESGEGNFTVGFSNFLEIDDISFDVTASLVSDGTDNPFNLNLFGQGDQLEAPKAGDISYVTKWSSTDTAELSNGYEFSMGDFLLSTVGTPSAFDYSLTPPNIESTFTINTQYQFVDDLSLTASGDNLLGVLDGTVTKELTGRIPEPSTFSLFALFSFIIVTRFIYNQGGQIKHY